jgi:Cu/Ag efflux protein CusF
MRKSAIALAAAALFGTVAVASAADVSGTIKSIDMTAKTVTLDNGQIYKLPSTFDEAKFKVGDKVKVTYSGTGSNMMASDIEKAS